MLTLAFALATLIQVAPKEAEAQKREEELRAAAGRDDFKRRERAIAAERERLLVELNKAAPGGAERRVLLDKLKELDAASGALGGGRFSQQYVDDMLHWARDFDPVAASRMEDALRNGRNDEAMSLARGFAPKKREMEDLRTSNPEQFEWHREGARLEGEAMKLADVARTAKGDERLPARDRFLEALGRVFEHREMARLREVQELERRLGELKDSLRRRQENRAKIIERRAQDLLGDEFDW